VEPTVQSKARTQKSINYHNNDYGYWCRWSLCIMHKGYVDERCPNGCVSSCVEVKEVMAA